MGGPVSLTQFFTGQHEIDRTVDPPTFGPFLSDPRCYYDPDAKRFVMTILQLPFDAQGQLLQRQVAHPDRRLEELVADHEHGRLDASSRSTRPTTARVADDGSGRTLPSHPGCPCFGDQPLLGADKYGIYITTNEFSILGPEFNGAQIYAIDKQRALGRDAQVPGDPGRADSARRRARLLAPACDVADRGELEHANNGTEYLLSALDFNATTDNRIAVWALTNTKSLDSTTPAVTLTAPAISPARRTASRRTPSRRRARSRSATSLGEQEELARDERRPHEPGRLRRRQAVERRQHGHPDVERSELADRSERDRVLHRHPLDAVRDVGRGHDREAGLRRPREQRQRPLPVDRSQRAPARA